MENNQVESQTPYANPEANPAMDNLQAAEQSVTATADEVNAAAERVAFERYKGSPETVHSSTAGDR